MIAHAYLFSNPNIKVTGVAIAKLIRGKHPNPDIYTTASGQSYLDKDDSTASSPSYHDKDDSDSEPQGTKDSELHDRSDDGTYTRDRVLHYQSLNYDSPVPRNQGVLRRNTARSSPRKTPQVDYNRFL